MSSTTIGGVESARAKLEEMILSGKMQPGDRLNELALASSFGISRSHLREAVRALEEARLVDVVANRGAQVRKLDLANALELFDVRAGLARSAGRLAVLRASRQLIKEIQATHRRLGVAASSGDMAKFRDHNARFHALLMEAAANERLSEMDLAVRNELQLYIRRNISSEAQLRLSCEEHDRIVAALLAGDSDACGAAFERHILNGKRRLTDSAPIGASPD
ncbi:MAG: GntR family transcriptional regulator [Pseudomonadota bacterium]|nr:GntR family transcriptional regulator [Pseudomonadota bacterium]